MAKYVCKFVGTSGVSCNKEILRPDQHLIKTHGLASKSPEYNEARKLCTRVIAGAPTSGSQGECTYFTIDTDILNQFKTYLASTSLNLKEKSINMYSAQVSTFCRTFSSDPSIGPVTCDVHKQVVCVKGFTRVDKISSIFRSLESKGSNPRTLRSRINTIINFIKFMMQHERFSGKEPELQSKFQTTIIGLGKLSKSLRSKVGKVFYDKKKEEVKTLFTMKEISQFLGSRFIIDSLNRVLLSSEEKPKQKLILQCRDVIIAILSFQCYQRSGVIIGLKVSEFEEKEKIEMENGDYETVIFVSKHKTYADSGPASLTANNEIIQAMEIYRKHVQSAASQGNFNSQDYQEFFFVTAKGSQLKSGTVTTCIRPLWDSAMRKVTNKKFRNMTQIRKSVTTFVHRNFAEFKGELAIKLAHRVCICSIFLIFKMFVGGG